MVLALVRRPTIAQMTTAEGGGSVSTLLWAFLVTSGKIAGFIVFVLIFGRRMIPALLHWVAHTGSRELFRLAVLAIALGVAFGAARSEEHTSELQSLMRISYAVFCLKKKKNNIPNNFTAHQMKT